MTFLADEVVEHLGNVLSVAGAGVEVGFVCGGGSGQIKDTLYPALLAKVSEMNSIAAFPMLYLDSSNSRHLNREGLLIAAEAVAARQAARPKGKRKAA